MNVSQDNLGASGDCDVSPPFPMGRSGGSRRTAISASATSTGATIRRGSRSARLTLLSDPETKSSCGQQLATRLLFGDEASTAGTSKPASSARCSVTRASRYRPSLSDRPTASLITSGLVCGITPSSIRKLSGQPIRVLAFDGPDGSDAGSPTGACSFLNAAASMPQSPETVDFKPAGEK